MIYLITYDLHKPGQDYEYLYETIKNSSTGDWSHHLESTWIIKSNLSVNQVAENIKSAIDENDSFLVIEVINNKQGWLPEEAWTYLNNNIF